MSTAAPRAPAEPIVAIATAPGVGGVGVVRLSFPRGEHAQFMQEGWLKKTLLPRTAHLVRLKDAQGALLDEGVALYFAAPHSFTGEHVIEFQGHGGPAVLQAVLQSALVAGATIGLRMARAGEFTERAFLNDKLDLAQAEAVADLIEASSVQAAKAAAASLQGVFSRQVQSLMDDLVHLRLLVEATLDFPEEEIEFLEKAGAREMLNACSQALEALRADAKKGAVMKAGLTTVLAGRPNVGKSSLLNALARDDVAIVSDIAGTTRDRVREWIHIEGVPFHLIDTAGLRDTMDPVEKLGIERTLESIAQADVCMTVLDMTDPDPLDEATVQLLQNRLSAATPVVLVLNKIDALAGGLAENTCSALGERLTGAGVTVRTVVALSAKTGQGVETLSAALLDLAGLHTHEAVPFMARERHVQALTKAAEHMAMAQAHARHKDQVLDLFAEELRLAHDSLGEITGKMLPDDLLGLIFSRFCIGK